MASKTIDLTKFRKKLTDKLGIPTGFNDPKIWLDTGNYTLNRLISGDYKRGVPLGRVTMFAGESGSGKSLLAANVIRSAQQHEDDIIILLLDSEGAGDEIWYQNAGVDTTKNLIRVPTHTVSHCTQVVSEFFRDVVSNYPDNPCLVVLDSVGMLETETGQEGFLKGKNKGDQGQLAKQMKKFVKNCVFLCEQKNVGFIMTNHTYDSQDMFNPDQKITGGAGIIYASSIVIATRKFKLKEVAGDKEVATSTGVHGVKVNAMVYKSRFNKPFEKMTIEVPWSEGVDPYSGLIDMFENDGLLVKVGNMLAYTDKSGKEHKYFRNSKILEKRLPTSLLDLIMEENPYDFTREDMQAIQEREQEIGNLDLIDDPEDENE